jgi:hypothetical protein
VRRDRARRVAGLRAHGAEHVQVVVLRLADRRRPRPDPRPGAPSVPCRPNRASSW